MAYGYAEGSRLHGVASMGSAPHANQPANVPSRHADPLGNNVGKKGTKGFNSRSRSQYSVRRAPLRVASAVIQLMLATMELVMLQLAACFTSTTAMRVLLVRHAQSTNNVVACEERSRTDISVAEIERSFESRRVHDPALSVVGEQQAEALVRSLLFDPELAFYLDHPAPVHCSPMRRTLLTASPLLAAVPHWRGMIDERVYEVGGSYSRRGGVEVANAGATPEALSCEFGSQFELSAALSSPAAAGKGWYPLDHRETREEATQRVEQLASWLAEVEVEGTTPLLVMVIHGDLLGYLLRALLGTKARFLHYNTACTSLECAGGRWTMLYQNRCEHLSGADRTGAEMLSVVS